MTSSFSLWISWCQIDMLASKKKNLLTLSCQLVCLSTWNNLPPTGWIFWVYIRRNLVKSVDEIQYMLKLDNKGHFTRSPKCVSWEYLLLHCQEPNGIAIRTKPQLSHPIVSQSIWTCHISYLVIFSNINTKTNHYLTHEGTPHTSPPHLCWSQWASSHWMLHQWIIHQ